MPTLTPESEAKNAILARLLARASMPFFLFSLVLCSSLLLSQALVLPRLTRVTVLGEDRDALSLRSLQADVLQKLGGAEQKRANLFTPAGDSALSAVRNARSKSADSVTIRSDILHLADSFMEEGKKTVFLSEIRIDSTKHQLSIKGDIRNIGPESLTVLATFRAELEKLSWVKRVEPGKFERLEDPKIGIHSPISITAVLQ